MDRVYLAIGIFLFDIWGSCYVAHKVSWGEWKVIPIIATSAAIAIVGIIVLINAYRYRKILRRNTIKS